MRRERHNAAADFLDHLKDIGALTYWYREGRYYRFRSFDGEFFGPYTLKQTERFIDGWRRSKGIDDALGVPCHV